ncbi:phosphatidylserine decarboxylase family protein [Blattabacterium cuenoti]|uniref:phosphatidylserine decarboxylase family protein n=1 Tax=Blattabacterium cuenoti TaxID=1653831 RepID=UPI001EECA6E8|nr:phosphatidylserine decarboxylase family protein [Blattabacterium cuenoti]
MMIHKEGIPLLIYILIFIIIILILVFFLFSKKVFYSIVFLCSIFYSFVIYFFRNPKRNFLDDSKTNVLVSPADGKILDIKNIFENEYLKKKCIKISIFLSLFDVHVNRYPISGKIVYVKHHPGKYYVAWLEKSSLENEHTTIVIIDKNKRKKILLRQIAGLLARRISFYAKKNTVVKKGEELGFIKFGSRLDIFIPLNSKLLIKKGEKVVGGITEISIIPK